jgi:tellurite resistance protein TerC
MPPEPVLFAGFSVFILAMLAIDLGVFHKKSHVVGLKEALTWSAVWIGLGLLFNLGLFFTGTPRTPDGSQAGLEFLTGFLIEKALAVDNIFVIAMLFTFFKVPAAYQHKVLFWGIIGALVLRGFFIWAGVELINRFHWMIYVFGALLIATGIKMFVMRGKESCPETNIVLRAFRKFVPVTKDYREDKFLVREGGRLFATPLAVVLVMVETTDLIFAVDSIPAIIAITRDPFIVFTSNVFAILGLRSLYFALAGLMDKFVFLTHGLSAILVFVGAKMAMAGHIKIPVGVSLGVIAGILTITVIASLIHTRRAQARDTAAPLDH